MGPERFAALQDFRTSDLFTPREKAALDYAEESTRHRDVRDAVFEELRKHFTDVEIVELTWLTAIENYFNLMKKPLQIGSDALVDLAEERTRREAPVAAG